MIKINLCLFLEKEETILEKNVTSIKLVVNDDYNILMSVCYFLQFYAWWN